MTALPSTPHQRANPSTTVAKPWVIAQEWHHLLFAHWPVPAEVLRPLLPSALDIDTFRGEAWLSIVAFHLRRIRLRGFPPVPFTSAFPELNVRTYVVHQGEPGVWFLSLDADNRLGISIARWLYRLPYLKAEIFLEKRGDEVRCRSQRVQTSVPAAEFEGSYRLSAAAFSPQPGTVEHWLTERYCFYVQDRGGYLYRGHVQHAPWLLQEAEAVVHRNTMASSHNIRLPEGKPLFHYANRLDAYFPLLSPCFV